MKNETPKDKQSRGPWVYDGQLREVLADYILRELKAPRGTRELRHVKNYPDQLELMIEGRYMPVDTKRRVRRAYEALNATKAVQ